MNLRRKRYVLMNSGVWKGHIRNISGNPVTLDNAMGLQTLEVLGNSIQDNTPSPDNPVEVVGVGEKTRNLVNINEILNENGYGNSDYNNTIPITPFHVVEGQKYVLVTKGEQVNTVYYSSIYFGESNLKYPTGDTKILGTPVTRYTFKDNVEVRSILTATKTCDITHCMIHGEGIKANAYKISELGVYEYADDYATMPYEPYGYKIPVNVEGRNLFDWESILDTETTVKYVEYDNRQCISWLSNATTDSQRFLNGRFKENTVYTFVITSNATMGTPYWEIVYTDGTSTVTTMLSNIWETKIKVSTVGKTISHLRGFYNSNQAVYWDINSIQILEGEYTAETMPPYEPYKEPQTINVYTPQVLHGLDDVNDMVTIDFDNRKAELVQNIEQDVFDGGWAGYSQTGNICRAYHATTPKRRVSPVGIIDVASDIFIATTASLLNNAVYQIAGNTNTSVINVTLDANALVSADIDGFNTFMTEHPATIYYVLKSPVTTDISNLQDWDNMPQLTGTIILTANSTAKPKFNVTYYSTEKE